MFGSSWPTALPHVVVACLLHGALACSDQDPQQEPHRGADAGGVDGSAPATPGVMDGGSARKDAGRVDSEVPRRPVPPAQCMPGRYKGELNCVVSGVLPWTMTMAFDLVEKTRGAGEIILLQIVPGTEVSGGDDSFQSTYSAKLSGTFDCSTGVLTGALEDGRYLLGGLQEYHFEGPLEGHYNADDGGVPELEGQAGPLAVTTFDALGPLAPSGDCKWSAPRVGDVEADAGP